MSATRPLEVLQVKEPCPEDWGAMDGDDRHRFCGRCERNVYDLSAMSRDEAEALLTQTEGRVCVRFYRRADGTVTTTDCAPDRLATLRTGARRSLAFAAVMIGGLLTLVTGVGYASLFGYHEIFEDHAGEDPCDVPLMGEALPIDEPVSPPEPPEASPTEDEPPAEG